MMKRISLQPAYVLHRRSYRETSFLVELFSKEHGRLSVIAKGARRPRSPLQGLLQPFVPLLVSFVGKGELMVLTHAEIQGTAKHLLGKSLYAGLYLNELLVCLLQQWDAHSVLYVAYEKALKALQTSVLQKHEQEEWALCSFEKCLVEELGYGLLPKSEVCLHNQFTAERYYRFIDNQGFVICEQPTGPPMESIEGVFSGKNLIAIALEKWEVEGCMADAKRLIKLLLAPLLGAKPLYSQQLFR